MDSNTNVNSFIPNEEQLNCINKINIFIKDHAPFSKVLINGSAGTGKTTIIISTIVNILVNQILLKIEEISALISTTANESIYKKPNWTQIPLNNFIISAPTNKAKDVLVTKYNIYIEEQLANVLQNIDLYNSDFVKSLRNINISTIIQILTSKIESVSYTIKGGEVKTIPLNGPYLMVFLNVKFKLKERRSLSKTIPTIMGDMHVQTPCHAHACHVPL